MKIRLVVIGALAGFAALASTSSAEIISTFEFTGGSLTPTMGAYATANSITVSDFSISPLYGDFFDNGGSGDHLRISGDDNTDSGTGTSLGLGKYMSFTVNNNSGDTLSLTALSFNVKASNVYSYSNSRVYSDVHGFDAVVDDTIGKIGKEGDGSTDWAVQTLDLESLGNAGQGTNITMGDFLVADGGSVTFYVPWVDASSSATRYVDVDDISISGTVIPEPATFGLLAVFGGGLMFIRRKLRN